MKLLKVAVFNFPILKDVELTFEPSLKPAIFPIGSQNGEKTIFLQLLFSLLTNNKSFFNPFTNICDDFKTSLTFDNGSTINYTLDRGDIIADREIDINCYLVMPSELRSKSPIIWNPNCSNGEIYSYSNLISGICKTEYIFNYQESKVSSLEVMVKKYQSPSTIFLFDEIENGLHPDWQYSIVNELASWGDIAFLGLMRYSSSSGQTSYEYLVE